MTIDQCARGPTDRDGEDDFGTDSVKTHRIYKCHLLRSGFMRYD